MTVTAHRTLNSEVQVEIAATLTKVPGLTGFDLDPGETVTCTFANNDAPIISSCEVSSYIPIRPSDLGLSATATQTGITGTYDVSSLFGLSAGLTRMFHKPIDHAHGC